MPRPSSATRRPRRTRKAGKSAAEIWPENPDLIECCRDADPSLARFFADGGHAGQKLEAAIAHLDRLAIEIIRRSDVRRFVVLPRRWVIERAVARLNRCRRLAKDWETSIASSEPWLVIASIRRMARRIAMIES